MESPANNPMTHQARATVEAELMVQLLSKWNGPLSEENANVGNSLLFPNVSSIYSMYT